MPIWNVYKVFASGKRAKMPYTTFEAEETQHFFSNILPSLGAKLQKSKWLVLNTEESQDRPAEARDEEKEKFEKDKIRVLGTLAARKFPELSSKKAEVCLAMTNETGWKWAWCVVQCASHKYIAEISERFDNSALADQWIKEQIECMAST